MDGGDVGRERRIRWDSEVNTAMSDGGAIGNLQPDPLIPTLLTVSVPLQIPSSSCYILSAARTQGAFGSKESRRGRDRQFVRRKNPGLESSIAGLSIMPLGRRKV